MRYAVPLVLVLALASLAARSSRAARDPDQPANPGAPADSLAGPDQPLPDLTISVMYVTIDPAAYCRWDQGTLGVAIRVENIGDLAAGPFRSQVFEREHYAAGLEAGAALELWFDEFRYIGQGETSARVDVGDTVRESREDNNERNELLPVPTLPPTCAPTETPTPVTGTPPPMPDLVPEFDYWWHCDCWPCPGEEPGADACVTNRGGAPAAPATNLVTYANSGVRERLISYELAPGESACRRTGNFSMEAIADLQWSVHESDEENNHGADRARTYTPPPPCATTSTPGTTTSTPGTTTSTPGPSPTTSATPTEPTPTATGTPTATATGPSPTPTPTSQPGPPVLHSPADGAVLPQPRPEQPWVFSWTARQGPCYCALTISGPGARAINEHVDYTASGYRFEYSSDSPIPDDALAPWHWSVTVSCPMGSAASEERSFSVESASPSGTATPTPELPRWAIYLPRADNERGP